MIRSICIISPGFPYKNDASFSFVEELVNAFARKKIKCYVIAPQSVSRSIIRRKQVRPLHWSYDVVGGITVDVFQPKYITFSTIKYHIISQFVFSSYCKAVEKVYKSHLFGKIDALYGHFWYAGICAGKIGKDYGIPAFVATGESTISIHKQINIKKFCKEFEAIKGVVCVSSKNRDESVEIGLTEESKCLIVPNAVNTDVFTKIDKHFARNTIGIKDSDFVVSFVGAFIPRKGVMRVSEAINQLSGVKSVFIGSGNQQPNCEGILFSGVLPHNQIPVYLNASDVFVLPTLAEGCCNAIIEALACGVPVISSDRSFNNDILSTEYSIRIDPESIPQIRDTIQYMMHNPDVVEDMSKKAFEYGHAMNIDNRAARILNFINEKANEVK